MTIDQQMEIAKQYLLAKIAVDDYKGAMEVLTNLIELSAADVALEQAAQQEKGMLVYVPLEYE